MSYQSRFFDAKRVSFTRQLRHAIRDTLSEIFGKRKPRNSRRRLRFEGLEDRRLLALVWANRGADSDMFDAAFAANAEVGRGVVDSALNEWNRVVTGYQGATFDVQLTIAMNPSNASLSAFASNTVRDANGVPISGNVTINMALDTGGNSQWYLDPTPDDHSEFMGTLTHAFARSPTPGGPAAGLRDLRTLLIHEIGHTMGISSSSPLMYSNPAITVTNTNISDNSVGVGGNSYWLFQGPSVNVVMTDFDINTPVTSSAGHNAMPLVGNPAITFNSNSYYTAVDTMQPTALSIRRILLTNKVALMMKDMGYNVTMPERNGTFHTVLDGATGLLTIQGGNDNTQINGINQGASSDNIVIQRFGDSLFVSVDIGIDVPGSGPGLNPLDQQGAMVSVFRISDVSTIHVDGFAGNDQISMVGNFDFLDLLDVHGGDGNDSINASALTGNQPLVAFGDAGVDTLTGGPAADSMNGGSGNDSINGGSGNDLINGNDGIDLLVGGDGSDTISGGNGNDRIIGGELIASLNDPLSDASGDTLNGDAGEDMIIGDDGSFLPLIVRQNIGGADTIRGGLNNDLIFGGAGADNIHGQGGNDNISGGRGNDTIIGGSLLSLGQSLPDGDDLINGEDGDDAIYGDNLSPFLAPIISLLGGNDVLVGGDGNDTLVGQVGNDQMEGNDGSDAMNGGSGNDSINGNDDNDLLVGGDGGDTISGGNGNDRLIGGELISSLNDPLSDASADTLNGDAGEDSLIGDDGSFLPLIVRQDIGGADTLRGGLNNDLIFGGAGADNIHGQGGNDIIAGGRGNDTIIGGSLLSLGQSLPDGDDLINGEDGDDAIYGDNLSPFLAPTISLLGGNDELVGGDGNDILVGQFGHDRMEGNDGWDVMHGGIGNDQMTGGAGNDTLIGDDGTDLMFGNSGNDELRGGDDNDILVGGTGNDDLFGDAGNDVANGESGADTIVGGDGDDRITGGDGNDVLIGGNNSAVLPDDGADQIDGDAGDDWILGDSGTRSPIDVSSPIGGADTIQGGTGNDTIFGMAGNDFVGGGSNDDDLFLGPGDDIANGDSGDDRLFGGPGNDILAGSVGKDEIIGNEGNDWLIGGNFTTAGYAEPETDDDTLDGREGQDLLFGDSWSLEYPFAENMVGGDDKLIGGNDNDIVSGQAGNDELRGGSGEDQLLGGDGNDSIRGDAGSDTISGGRGNDQLRGDDGDDLIRGDDGDDLLFGGTGNDILLGGGGKDSINGNEGRDLLIGGRNGDVMNGNDGDDLLIAGFTSFDNNDVALHEVMLEWNSARGYLSRVANLRGMPNVTFDSRLNGNTFLQKGVTVIDDDEVDTLKGGAGSDWFLLDKMAPLPDDLIADLQVIEVIN